MPIDFVNAPKGSPDWWLNFLSNRFNERDTTYDLQDPVMQRRRLYTTRRHRLNSLWSYYIGEPPLPQVAEGYTETFRDVLRKARATYAPMTIRPMLDRMSFNGVRTGVDSSPNGDDVAARIMEFSNFQSALKDAFTYTFTMSEGYLMVIPARPESPDRTPLITAEDPRLCIGQPDPANPNRLLAGLKLGWDQVDNVERAWLFVGGRRYQYVRPGGTFPMVAAPSAAGGFEADGDPLDMPELNGGVPMVQLVNERRMGEYEPHIDLLDRINDGILQRIILAWYQSFRQRGVIGDLEPEEDETADAAGVPVPPVDLNDVFRADPGALWKVPAGVTFWESSQADLNGMLLAIRDDVKELAAVTSTPLHLITPDAANQSAEGASLMREGLVYKVKDRRDRLAPRLKTAFQIAFALAGEEQRGKDIQLLWGSAESFSLAEQSNAAAQTRGLLSRYRQLTSIFEMTPEEAQQNIQELLQDEILNAQLTVPPPPTQVRLTENVTSKVSPGQPAPPTPSQVP